MENPNAVDHALWRPRVNPWLIAATVALAAFMEVLDTSIANVALPHIAGSLAASTDQATWVLTSYLVSNAIVLPLGGWASNLMGRRNFFVLCITIFTIASFLCGIAPSLPLLLLFRVIQGAGGGGMQPMAQAIMADSFEPQKRGQAFALYGLVAVLAPSIGPTLGGWITDNFSWRWIFFINIPVGILAFILVTRLVDDPPWIKADLSRIRNMDYMGLAFLTLAMGGLQIMLDKGEENDWFSSKFIWFFAIMFVLGMVGLIVREWNVKNPLINLRLFRFKNFAICCFLMMLVGGVLNANTVLQPQFTQQLLGYNATTAGLALTAGGVALVIMMPLAGYATGKFSARTLTVAGFIMFTITFRYAAEVTNLQMSFAEASWLRVVQMLPLPFCFISITNAAYVGMPKEESNQVAGLINFVRNIGGSILIAITNAQVTSRAMWHQQQLQQDMVSGAIGYQQHLQALSGFLGSHFGGSNSAGMALASIYNQLNQQAQMQGYQDVYMELCYMSIVLVALAFLLSKSRPGERAEGGAMH
ncbi:MAG TPA: DHA2 family efflux MFS transporter permease subunit [Terracidiphilus sp.]|jgi:DHA2 family multidrug resistance protein|nr:DHA2 family efflux MFS transporter permease subunit [Terracidiphilus sp.]